MRWIKWFDDVGLGDVAGSLATSPFAIAADRDCGVVRLPPLRTGWRAHSC